MEPSENALGKRPAPAVDGAEPESEAKTARVDESKSPSPDGAAGDGERRGKKPKRAIRGNGKERGLKERRGTRTEPRDETEERGPRLPKRQCALLLGYAGTGYSGMQVQKDAKTIENTLFTALVAAGAVSQDNADDPVKVNLNRAARTDAGVHAAGNVVSLKMICVIPGVPDVAERINELLPPEIRLWSFTRVQNSFNARTSCDSRKYTYFFPSYMLIPPKPGGAFAESSRRLSPDYSPEPHPFWAESAANSTAEDDLCRKREWRCSPTDVEALRAAAARYERSHNFHNFTVGRDFSDRSSQRFMKSLEVEEPVVYGDTEWIAVQIHGQSFMLHQRKMMCALVMSCRMGAPPLLIDELLGPRRVLIPKMPALGLLLEQPLFDNYNRKVASAGVAPDSTDYRAPLDFAPHVAEIAAFKSEHIYARMRALEGETGLFDAWARHLDKYAGDDLNWLLAQGSVPDSAVIKQGVYRAHRFREQRKFDMTGFTKTDGLVKAVDFEADEGSEDDEKIDKKALAEMEG